MGHLRVERLGEALVGQLDLQRRDHGVIANGRAVRFIRGGHSDGVVPFTEADSGESPAAFTRELRHCTIQGFPPVLRFVTHRDAIRFRGDRDMPVVIDDEVGAIP